jgi:hypothetical protein
VTITEAARHHLHQSLSQIIGEEDAAVLMEHLPPVGWADVASRRDLDHLEAVLRLEMEAIEHRLAAKIDQVDARLDSRIDKLEAKIDGRLGSMQAEFTKQLLLANSVMIGLVFGMVQFIR